MFCYHNSYLYLDCSDIQRLFNTAAKIPTKIYKYFTSKQRQHCHIAHVMKDLWIRYQFFLAQFLLFLLFNISFLTICSSWPAQVFLAGFSFFLVVLWRIQLSGVFISCEHVMNVIRSFFCSSKILSRMALLCLICPVSTMPQALNFL